MYIARWANKKICLIHDPRNSSDECKVLGEFGAKYAEGRPTKFHGNHTVLRKTFNRQQ